MRTRTMGPSMICYLVLLFLKIRLLGAQQVTNTSSNQANSSSSVQPRFPFLSVMGFTNFGLRRFGNPTSNYPTHSFFPFRNQHNYMHRPHQGYGMGLQNQRPNQGNYQNRPIQGSYPEQQSYPYQGDSMNPSPNYQEPSYTDTPSDAAMYRYHNPNQENFQNRPIQGGSSDGYEYPYQGDSMSRYPNYQQPTYSEQPDDASMYHGYSNRPHQNGRVPSNQGGRYNWLMPGPSMDQEYQYHPSNQHNLLGYQPKGNPNIRPNEINLNRPDEINNFHNINVQFPDHSNQYYPQNFMPGSEQPDNFQYHSTNINPITNVDPSGRYFSKPDIVSPVGPVSDLPVSDKNGGNLNKIPQNQSVLPKNKGIDKNVNAGDKEAIPVKPVSVSSTTASPSQVKTVKLLR